MLCVVIKILTPTCLRGCIGCKRCTTPASSNGARCSMQRFSLSRIWNRLTCNERPNNFTWLSRVLRIALGKETPAPIAENQNAAQPAAAEIALALQLLFCFEVRSLSDRLVSSSPERPCDDVRGLDPLSSEPDGDAADFLD